MVKKFVETLILKYMKSWDLMLVAKKKKGFVQKNARQNV